MLFETLSRYAQGDRLESIKPPRCLPFSPLDPARAPKHTNITHILKSTPEFILTSPDTPFTSFKMTGTPTYKPEEIEFVLHELVRKTRHSKIREEFQLRFKRALAPNQIRYVKNKYGRDSRYE